MSLEKKNLAYLSHRLRILLALAISLLPRVVSDLGTHCRTSKEESMITSIRSVVIDIIGAFAAIATARSAKAHCT
jgi:hypothetical protein